MGKGAAIGIFDSGIGGLTVLQQVARVLAHEPLVYLGDTARTPYGTKSPDVVRQYACENSDFLMNRDPWFFPIYRRTPIVDDN